jgi:hypothetical protein
MERLLDFQSEGRQMMESKDYIAHELNVEVIREDERQRIRQWILRTRLIDKDTILNHLSRCCAPKLLETIEYPPTNDTTVVFTINTLITAVNDLIRKVEYWEIK